MTITKLNTHTARKRADMSEARCWNCNVYLYGELQPLFEKRIEALWAENRRIKNLGSQQGAPRSDFDD